MTTPKARPARPDPFKLARAIGRQDVKKLIDDLWTAKSLPPGWLGRLTPHEFATLFMRSADPDDEMTAGDALSQLAKANADRGKAKQLPLVPLSLLARLDPRQASQRIPTAAPQSGVAPLAGGMMGFTAAAPVGTMRR